MSIRLFGPVEDQDSGYGTINTFYSPFCSKKQKGASATIEKPSNTKPTEKKTYTKQVSTHGIVATCTPTIETIQPVIELTQSNTENDASLANLQIQEDMPTEVTTIEDVQQEETQAEEVPIEEVPLEEMEELEVVHKKKKHKKNKRKSSEKEHKKKKKSKRTESTTSDNEDVGIVSPYFHPEHKNMFEIIDENDRELIQRQENNDMEKETKEDQKQEIDEEDKKHEEKENQVIPEEDKEEDEKTKKAREKVSLEETCRAIRETVLQNNTDAKIICKWYWTATRLFSGNYLLQSIYPLFGERNPESISDLFLRNITLLREIDFSKIESILRGKPYNTDETKYHNEVVELFRTWHSIFHAYSVLYASKNRKVNGTVIPIPQYIDHIPEEIEDVLGPDQELLVFLYQRAEFQQLRRDEKNNVYEPFVTPDDHHTYYYKRKCTLQEFIEASVMPRASYPKEYDIYTFKYNTPKHMFNLISSLPDPRFPLLKRNPNLFSFDNGILDIGGDIEKCILPMTFYEYKDRNLQRIRGGWKKISDLPKDSITCNYIKGEIKSSWWPTVECQQLARIEKHKMEEKYKKKKKTIILTPDEEQLRDLELASPDEFNSVLEKWRKEGKIPSLPEPEEEKIDDHIKQSEKRELRIEQKRLIKLIQGMAIWNVFKMQDFRDEDVYWFGALMGRMIAKKDKLEVAPYLRGVGGTGKSTILKLILAMLDPIDVTLVQDDGRKGFSDQHMIGKRIVAALDIGSKPNFSKTRLNSYISKEPMLTDILYGESKVQTDSFPTWMLAGNGQPPWSDLSGCIARRIIIFLFTNIIGTVDTDLFDKCLEELPKLLVVFQFMYLDMIEHLAGRGVWSKDLEGNNIMSSMVYKAKQSFLVCSSSLSSFLDDTDWIINTKTDEKKEVCEDHTITQKQFNTTYERWRKFHGLRGDIKGINIIEDSPILKVFGIQMKESDNREKNILSGIKLAEKLQ